MSRKLFFLHTVPSLIGMFTDLSREIMPTDVNVFHIVDEMLLKMALAERRLTPFIYRRVADHARAAEQAGGHLLQLTCSSISPCADAASPMVDIPVLKVDEPMVDQAISIGSRIGVAATLPSTLKPTAELVQARASAISKAVEVDSGLCEGAFDALSAGHPEEHDRIVREGLKALMSRNQVIVLAQASMARVADTIPSEERVVPILSSPRSAVERARAVLEQVTG